MSKEQLQSIRALLASGQTDAATSDFADMRANMETMTSAMPAPEGSKSEKAEIGGIAGEWQWSGDCADDRALLYFHGGGYAIGSSATHRHLVSMLSGASGMKAFSADYRLAPEDPFPAAVEDAVAAYRGLLDVGFAAQNIAVAGDSAGGGLSLALLLAAKERGLPQPACAALLSPWCDLRISSDTYESRADADPMITRPGITRYATAYLNGQSADTILASPLLGDLSGLAPMIIHVGDAEVLLDDSLELAKHAQAAGADVTLKVWDDMIHVFQAFYPMLNEGQQSIEEMGAFMRERTMQEMEAQA